MNIQETIKRCQIGEKEAFKELFSTVERKALFTANIISGSRGIAEDILQETYIKCFREINNIKEPQVFKIWFYKILVRTGWEMSKKYKQIIPLHETVENDTLFNNKELVSGHTFDNSETRIIVKNAVNNLSRNLRTVVILYYYDDMTIEDISKILNCLKATVKSRLFYARTVLKRQLKYKIKWDIKSNFHNQFLEDII